jgi:long-chain acyl-CoA synthetase
VVAGAAPLPEGLAAEFAARTGVRVDRGYGLTEAAPGVTLGLGDGATGQGYVGSPLPGVELRIGDGRDPSEPGEVAVRGDNLFSGYWPHGTGGPDEQGWFRTGDIGYLEDGGLYLVDRARELVIVNGFNVYPAEVEQVILELPDVAAVAVVGRPDPRTGEQVVAFVAGEPTSDPGAGAGPLARRVEEHCADRLARFKRPTSVSVLPELPRGATGKVRKGLLREMLGTAEAR